MSSGQFRIKVFSESCHARGEAWLRPGSLSPQPGVDPRACDTRVCSHGSRGCLGRAAAAGSRRSPRAVPGRTLPGIECPAGPARTCPSRPRPSGKGLRARGLRAWGSRGSSAPGASQGQSPAEPWPPAAALPRSRRPRSRRCSSGAPSRLPGPPQPLPCSRVGCERRRGSGTAARAAPTLPPESGVEHSASPRGANEEDVAATAPPTSERGTFRTPASRHASLPARPARCPEGRPELGVAESPAAARPPTPRRGTGCTWKGTAGKAMSGLRVPQWDHQQVLWRF